MEIPFTEHVLPDGRKRRQKTSCPPGQEGLVQRLLLAGYSFHAEVLRTGHVSMTVERNDDDPPIAIEICENSESGMTAGLNALLLDAAKSFR